MDENTADIRRLTAKSPLRFAAPRRLIHRLGEDWRRLGQLANKAKQRVRSARGFTNKVNEIRWIAGKAQERVARRLGLASPAPALLQTDENRRLVLTAQRTTILALLPDATPRPACVPIGGGAFLVALDKQQADNAWLRDSYSNLHEAKITVWEGDSGLDRAGAAQLLVQAPSDLMYENPSALDLVVRSGEEQLVFENVPIENLSSLTITSFEFVNACVSFSGTCTGSPENEYSVGLFVDGDLSATGTIAAKGSSFSGTILLDRCHLDGRPHQLELRQLPYLSLLASSCQVTPLHTTPWNALQTYARPPLDGTLSQQARHHFRSYQLWFERLRDGGQAPPLETLYAELQQGFKKRREYPRIAFPLPDQPTVSVVIPVHNKFEVTYFCLCSLLFAFNETPFEVIVVDDGSTDETRRIEEFVSGVRILKQNHNQGFVGSCNAGAELARGDFVAFLNNDTEVTARWLDELVSVFGNFDGVGLAGAKLVYPDGRLQEAGGVIWGSGNPWNLGRNASAEDPRYNYVRKADYVSGAALMIRRELWRRVGGFSEEFAPGYFEDTDLAMKVREAGYCVLYVPHSVVYHFEGQTGGTSITTGPKAYQEVNRPKFQKKWARAYRGHGREGENVDREKDRDAAFRVLFIDHQFPSVDLDAGSYAAFQEIRLLQRLGAKVTFLPRNIAWMDRHTTALQRIGVECLYAPFIRNFLEFVRAHAADYDLVFVCRYNVAAEVVPIVRSVAPLATIAFNLADLHFMREFREAAAKTPGYSFGKADETRRAELATIMRSDLTFSYSDVEIDAIRALVHANTKLARMPWVVDCRERDVPYADTRDILFLGGFNHPPNVQAAKFFAATVMPLLRDTLPDVRFNIIGSGARTVVPELVSDRVRVLGYVPSLDEHFGRARIFVAPLVTGAGLKGKVAEAISHGTPCILSPVAAEGTGLTDGVDCLIANSPEEWADRVVRLYSDEALWNRIAANALELARTRYSFDQGVTVLQAGLATASIPIVTGEGLAYKHARPDRYGC
ncbi:MAG TPA: glycosyltransferase [Rhizomicrobium sp.]|jgi:GT2 family glycosyltransferase|nr:glycosyltransferase [Rhizomicrobium sp.]